MNRVRTAAYGPYGHLPVFAGAAALFIAFSAAGLNAALLEWEWVSLSAASDWARGVPHEWLFDHPPLYPFLLSLFFRIFGASPESARIFNMLPLLLSSLFVYLSGRRLFGRSSGTFAAAFCLLSPVAVQGIRSMDSSDTNLLPLMFSFMVWIFSVRPGGGKRSSWLLAAALAIACWAKFTSSLGLMIVMLCSLPALKDGPGGWKRGEVLRAVLSGLCLFIVSWSSIGFLLWGYDSWLLVLGTPFRYFSSGGWTPAGALAGFSLDLSLVVFWFSPFLIFLGFYGRRSAMLQHDRGPSADFLALVCLLYFSGYLVIDGSNYGFPRYHAAILPLLCVFAGASASVGSGFRTPGVVAAAVLAGVFSFLIDPLRIINLDCKIAFLQGGTAAGPAAVAAPLVVYLLAPLTALALRSPLAGWDRRHLAAFAAAAFVSSAVATSARQALAEYSTSYQYGASGKGAVVELVRDGASDGDAVMATREFAYDLRDRSVRSPGWGVWRSDIAVRSFLEKERPSFVVAGWTTHSVEQLGWLLKKGRSMELLEKEYILSTVGTYFVWKRK